MCAILVLLLQLYVANSVELSPKCMHDNFWTLKGNIVQSPSPFLTAYQCAMLYTGNNCDVTEPYIPLCHGGVAECSLDDAKRHLAHGQSVLTLNIRSVRVFPGCEVTFLSPNITSYSHKIKSYDSLKVYKIYNTSHFSTYYYFVHVDAASVSI